jgi:hypothetical protein
MRGPCGTLILKPAAARLRTLARLFATVFDQGVTASKPSMCNRRLPKPSFLVLDQSALSEITEIVAGRTFDQVNSELEQADFPGVIHAVNDRAERFVFALDLAPGSIDH